MNLYSVTGLKQLFKWAKKEQSFSLFTVLRLSLLAATLTIIVAIYRSLRANKPTVLVLNESRFGTLFDGLKTRSKDALDHTTVF